MSDADQWKEKDLHYLLTERTKVVTDALRNNPRIETVIVEAPKKIGIVRENGNKSGIETANVLAEITVARRKVRTMTESLVAARKAKKVETRSEKERRADVVRRKATLTATETLERVPKKVPKWRNGSRAARRR